MYPLEFKDDASPILSKDWTLVVDYKEIDGPIVLSIGNKCVSGAELVEFGAEPDDVDQVLVAAWIGDSLTLRNVRGLYLEYDNGWVFRSKAVSDKGMFKVDDGFKFIASGKIFEVEGHREFLVLTQLKKQPVEAPTISQLEALAGRSLDASTALELYRAADEGKLHKKLSEMRASYGRRI